MSVSEKLYPPSIDESIPAFYKGTEGAILSVPFSMNRAVDSSEITGFSLKIKTVQGNKPLGTFSFPADNNISDSERQQIINEAIKNQIVEFNVSSLIERTQDQEPIIYR